MDQRISISDGLGSDINRFAAENDIDVDHAYELLLAVGLDTLEGVAVDVYIEDDRLVLECPDCGAAFGRPEEALDHECADHGG